MVTLTCTGNLNWKQSIDCIGHLRHRTCHAHNENLVFYISWHNAQTTAPLPLGQTLFVSLPIFQRSNTLICFTHARVTQNILADRVLTSSPANTNLLLSSGHWTTPTLFRDVLTTITIPISKSVHPNLNNIYTHLQISSPIWSDTNNTTVFILIVSRAALL